VLLRIEKIFSSPTVEGMIIFGPLSSPLDDPLGQSRYKEDKLTTTDDLKLPLRKFNFLWLYLLSTYQRIYHRLFKIF
jgi:hypothetical protein